MNFYDKATYELMEQATDFDVPVLGKFSLPEMVFLLRESFKSRKTYKAVFDFPCDLPKNADPATDFCAISSYYIYEKTGGADVWKMMNTVNPHVHWWLQHKIIQEPFDITWTQFKFNFPYNTGNVETRLQTNPDFFADLRRRAHILGRCAGME